MSDSGRDTDLIGDDVKANHSQRRTESGQTWTQMSEQFRRDAQAAGPGRGRGYSQLAEWADREAAAEAPAKRATRRRQQAAAAPEQVPATETTTAAPSAPLQQTEQA